MQTTLLMAVQSSEIFEIYREQYDKVAWDLAMDMARNVLSEDGQTFQSSVRQIISTVESQLCMEEDSSEDEDCNEFKGPVSSRNWYILLPMTYVLLFTETVRKIPSSLAAS